MNLNDEPQVSPDVPTKHESCGVWCVCVFVVDSDGHRLPATAATVTAAAAAGDADPRWPGAAGAARCEGSWPTPMMITPILVLTIIALVMLVMLML